MIDRPSAAAILEIEECVDMLDDGEMRRHAHSLFFDVDLLHKLFNVQYLVRSFEPDLSRSLCALADELEVPLLTQPALLRRIRDVRRRMVDALIRAYRLHEYPDIRLEEERAPDSTLPVD